MRPGNKRTDVPCEIAFRYYNKIKRYINGQSSAYQKEVAVIDLVLTTDNEKSHVIKNVEDAFEMGGHLCDALQQIREQVAQAYFEIWTSERGIHSKITRLSTSRFLYLP